MRKLIVIALGLAALLALVAMPTAAAQAGLAKRWVWGPPTCVRVWMFRSRQTRYAGAPRCRRVPV